MAKAHVIDIDIQTHDKTSQGLRSAEKNLKNFDRTVDRTTARLKKMAASEYNVVIRAIDRVTPEGSKIRGALRSITGKGYNVTIKALDRASASIKKIHGELKSLTSRVWSATVNVRQNMAGKANAALQSMTGFSAQMLAGAGIGYGIYDTVQTYKSFEKQMSAVGAISGATGAELQKLTDKAMEMGGTTVFSATESAKAFEYMAMAGWKTEDMVNGVEGIIKLAAASGEDLGRVSDIVTDALTAFGLQASDSAKFADVLAQTASNANTNVGLLGYSFKYVAPLAGSLKYSIEDVNLALGLMANAGLKGEQSGSQLRNIIAKMISPTKEGAAWIERLGINVKNADGTMKPFKEVLDQLRKGFAGLTDAEKAQAAADMVGLESMAGLQSIVNATADDYNKLAGAIDNATGAADRQSKAKLDNLAGDITLLGSAWETFQLKLMTGTGSGNFLRDFVQGLTKDIEKLTKYLEDGLDISDIGRIVLDVIKQLKDEFLKLDGVGSILAGGALAAGLYKIAGLSKDAIDAVTDVYGKMKEAGGGGDIPNIPSPKDMAISANTVIVNAKNMVEGGPDYYPPGVDVGSGGSGEGGKGGKGGKAGAGGAAKGAETAATKGGSKGALAKLGKFGSKYGGGILAGVMAAGFGAYDVYSTKEANAAQEAQMSDAVKKAQEQYDFHKANGMDMTEVEQNLAEAKQAEYDQQVANRASENGAVGGAIGSTVGGIAGGIVGTMVGGPVGTMIGGMLGSLLGDFIGSAIGENFDAIYGTIVETIDSIGNTIGEAFDSVYNSIAETFNSVYETVTGTIDEIGNAIGNEIDYVCGVFDEVSTAVWDVINTVIGLFVMAAGLYYDVFVQPWVDAFNAAWECLVEIFTPVAAWFEESVWTPLCDRVNDVYETLSEYFQMAWDYICSLFSSTSSWFEESVWTPLCDEVAALYETMTGYFQSAWDYVCSLWGQLTGWFESTIWSPLCDRANSVYETIKAAFENAVNAVKNAWNGVVAWFEENVINPLKEKFGGIGDLLDKARNIGASITGKGSGSETQRAGGGFVFSPQHTLIGENGPEVVIPLGAGARDRAFDLFERTATMLGINDAPKWLTSDDTLVPNTNTLGTDNMASMSISVDIGGIAPSFVINSDGNADTASIMSQINENMSIIADRVAAKIAEHVGAIRNNQPLRA